MSNSTILVSIVVPIYNVEAYIIDCLSSIYLQKYNELEVILVDDCSPDNSMLTAEGMIEQLKNKYQVKVVTHEINKGLSAARNSGVKVATGDYIYFLDSDDELTPECIGILVDLVNSSDQVVDFAVSGIQTIGSSCSYPVLSASCLNSTTEILTDFFQKKWPVMAWNKLIKKKLFFEENIWFEEGLLHEDELFSFVLASKSKVMVSIPAKTYIYKVRTSGSITSDRGLRNYESKLQINKYRYRLIADYIFKELKIQSSMSFMIDSTFDFICSVHHTTSLPANHKYSLINNQLHIFFKYLSLRLCLSMDDYEKLFLIIRYKIGMVFKQCKFFSS